MESFSESTVVVYKLGQIESKLDELVKRYDEREAAIVEDIKKNSTRIDGLEKWQNKQERNQSKILGGVAVIVFIFEIGKEWLMKVILHA